MNQFFEATFLLSFIFIGLIVYYTIKNRRSRLKRHQEGDLLFAKIYEDEKVYIRNRLKSLLADLQEGKIHWLLIYSRLFPEDQVQITYSLLDQEINLVQRSRSLSNNEKEYLKHLGVNKYCTQADKIILSTELNSKIITDLIYFLFENICNQHKAHNIKINISGE
jgi:hypothetical protein